MGGRSRIDSLVRPRWVVLWALCLASLGACGGVAKQESASRSSQAGADAVDSGTDAADAADASPPIDASPPLDAAPTDAGSSDVCCDTWTGGRSQPKCIPGICSCHADSKHEVLQPAASDCASAPEACRVEYPSDLQGKVCSPDVPYCKFSSGTCSFCLCHCPEDTLVWDCQCTLC